MQLIAKNGDQVLLDAENADLGSRSRYGFVADLKKEVVYKRNKLTFLCWRIGWRKYTNPELLKKITKEFTWL